MLYQKDPPGCLFSACFTIHSISSGMLKKAPKKQEPPMGQGMMIGSNAPWAEGRSINTIDFAEEMQHSRVYSIDSQRFYSHALLKHHGASHGSDRGCSLLLWDRSTQSGNGISGRQLPEDPSRLLTCVGGGKARGAVSGKADGDSYVGDPPHLESPLSGNGGAGIVSHVTSLACRSRSGRVLSGWHTSFPPAPNHCEGFRGEYGHP